VEYRVGAPRSVSRGEPANTWRSEAKTASRSALCCPKCDLAGLRPCSTLSEGIRRVKGAAGRRASPAREDKVGSDVLHSVDDELHVTRRRDRCCAVALWSLT